MIAIDEVNKFQSEHKGKCCDCGNIETLDAMIRKNNSKGTYHCKECEIDEYLNSIPKHEIPIEETRTKLKKFITKLTG